MNRQVSVLAVIAVLALGMGVWLSQSPSNKKFEAVFLFDNLQKMANQLDSVEITNAQGVLFSAQKLDQGWFAIFNPEQPAYPISQRKLADFVETMMRVKLVEAKTNKPENYERLGLQPLDIDDSMASLVTLRAGDNSWQVLVGNKVAVGDGHYILKSGDPQSWRTDNTIGLPIDKFSWLKQPVLPYEVQDISSISRVDSLNWQITRTADGDFQLANLQKGQELKYGTILNSIVSSLTSLDFEQLLPLDEDFAQSLKVLTQLEVSTEDGDIFQVVVSEVDDKNFINFSANGLPVYWHKWYYQISNFSAQQLIKTQYDFLAEEDTTASNSDVKSPPVEEGDSPN